MIKQNDKPGGNSQSRYPLLFRDICYILLLGYISINYYLKSPAGNYLLLYISCAGYIYSLVRGLLIIRPAAEIIIRIILLAWGMAEAIYGELQLYDLAPANNYLYAITGSLQNPGPFAGFLAIMLPLAIHMALEPPGNNKLFRQTMVVISCIYIFLALIILPATMSRAGWIAAVAGSSIILFAHYRIIFRLKQYLSCRRKAAILYLTTTGILLLATGAGFYYMKKDSADGRLLIWEVSTRVIAENSLTGIGLGNFAGAYGQAQTDYFAEGNATAQEKYVAGSPEYAFNEFLQITTEHGLVGLLLFLIVMALTIQNAVISGQSGIAGSLTAFLGFACFSYPFSVWQLNLLFIILVATAGIKRQSILQDIKAGKQKIYAIGIVLLIFALPLQWAEEQWTEKQEAISQWKNEQAYYNMEIYKQTVDNYRKLYPQLRDEPKFLFELGQCLSKTESYEESNRILREGLKLSSDPMFRNIMGKNFQAMHRYHEAEECYTAAYNMVPHRIYPLYLLANLYFLNGEEEKGIAMAKRVIQKEPKVISAAVMEIKAEMEEKVVTSEDFTFSNY